MIFLPRYLLKFLFLFLILYCNTLFATEKIINLTVSYKTVCYAGKYRKAIALNQQIPGPTLRFKEGDHVTINVHNTLDQETAIHWHGLLVPWQMDGVLGITQRGIPPGGFFKYQFTVRQAGTYWYHAHAGLQEQQGLYGAFIIDPRKPPTYHYTKDYAIVLSDWSNTYPDQILANLKKSGDYYSPKFPLQPSLEKFLHDYHQASTKNRRELINDYLTMQTSRMNIYDISDVAYDTFLLNGHERAFPWHAPVKIGDTVRLRFIGAAGDTIFHVKIPYATMQMVHAEGNDVRPYTINDFTIAPGETYDVLVHIEKNQPYFIYAESSDQIGAALGVLATDNNLPIMSHHITPFKEPLPVTRTMMSMMDEKAPSTSMPMGHHTMPMKMPMNHAMPSSDMDMSHSMSMAGESERIGDSISPPPTSATTSLHTKYQPMIAGLKTNDPNKPVDGVINMELFGYMDRFIWFINGVPEYKAKPIIFQPNKRYRIVFKNTSMMHHPMHIHGHWFILRNGHGAYDPLLHTLDVPPGATIVADIDTDASGQWFFHCHMLYHMITGMARVFQYSTLIEITQNKMQPENIIKPTGYYNRPIVRVDEVRPIDVALVHHPMAHPVGFWFANDLTLAEDFFHNTQMLTFKGLYGPDYHKLELFINDAEIDQGKTENADIDIFYWHLLNQFWAIKGGVNYFNRPALKPYWQPGIGVEGLLPFFIETDVRGYYYQGSVKADIELSRDTQITNNFFVRVGIRGILASKTITSAQLGSGLNEMRYSLTPYYRLTPGLNIFAEYEHDVDYGAFKKLQQNSGESTLQNNLFVGLEALF